MKKEKYIGETNLKSVISEVLVLLFSSERREPIKKALTLLLDFFNADWVYVASFSKEQRIVDFLYEANSPWVHVPEDDSPRLSFDSFPWIINTLLSGEDIILNDIKELPSEAEIDKKLFEKQQLSSTLMIPLSLEGEIQGMIGFDSTRVQRTWTLSEVEDMHMIAGIFSVIIEREQAKSDIQESRTQLNRSNTKFKMFFENLPLGVELYDAKGFLIDINEADTKIFGVKKEDVLGVNLFDNPNTRGKISETFARGTDFSFPIEYRFNAITESGYYPTSMTNKVKYLQVKGLSLTDENAEHVGYLLIISDNTESYLKSERTEENLAKLKAALLSGRSVIGEYDLQKDLFALDPLLNKHIKEDNVFYYLKNRTLSFEEIKNIIPANEIRQSKFRIFWDILEERKKSGSVTYRKEREDGIIWIRLNMQTYKSPSDGSSRKVICYLTDVTDQMEMASRLRETELKAQRSEMEMLKAREADKLKSSFLANMSHEIRTPLNAIVGFSEIIAETEDYRERRKYMDIIHKNNELLLQLITDILDFSKIESGVLDYHFSRINIKDICRGLYLIHSLKTQPDVRLIYEEDVLPDIFIYTDAKRIMQVISNFLSNAIKFTKQGCIVLSYGYEGGMVRISVKDTGIGISEEYKKTIFERFVKVNDFIQGTGLGLAICKTIVETLKGKIGFTSELGSGTTFWFTLPLEKERVDLTEEEPEKGLTGKQNNPVKNKYTLLIAEDVEANYHLLEVLLKKQYNLLHACNGKEAVTLFGQHDPDLILMDLKMPEMDGFEATRKIRQQSESVPVIALSAFAFEKDKQFAKECKFNDYLVKPLNINQLRNLLDCYLKK